MRRYDLIRNDGAIWLDSWLGEDCISASAMRRTLRQLGDRAAIDVFIDSPGGCTREGFGIYISLRECRKPVNVVVVGLAGSMAAIIAMAARDISVLESAQFHLHNSMAATDGRTINGRPHLYGSELKTRAAQCARDDAIARDIFCGRTGLPADHIKRLCDAETTLTAPEAVQLGFASRVISTEELENRRAVRAVANTNDAPSIWDVA